MVLKNTLSNPCEYFLNINILRFHTNAGSFDCPFVEQILGVSNNKLLMIVSSTECQHKVNLNVR